MLQLRPTCEHCNKALPPHSDEALICSYECTFCHDCVILLADVCPNCGGNFVPRPVRLSVDLKSENFLGKNPATEKVTYKPVDLEQHQALVQKIKALNNS